MKLLLTLTITCFLVMIFPSLYAQKGLPAKKVININHTTNYPQHVDFNESMVKQLKVPAGWTIIAAATGLGKPRMLCTGANNELYITRRDVGDVLMLKDTDGDKKFDDLTTVVADFKGVHGIAIRNGWMYLCSNRELVRYALKQDGTVGQQPDTLMKDLPDGGQHPNRTIAFGPDGLLYISVGSTCNDCSESNREAATMLTADTVTWQRKVFARGLRNTIGFDFHPQTGVLWGADNGGDTKGDDWPPEEINKIEKDGNYGWPLVYAKQVPDETRDDPQGSTKAQYAKLTKPSVLELPAHSAPIAFQFIRSGTFVNDALVCWHGSWNRSTPQGFKVQRIKFLNGMATGAEDLVTGFLDPSNRTRFGRPAGLTVANNGIVYISDDANGVIYALYKNN